MIDACLENRVAFFAVHGKPIPAGSKRAFVNKHTGRAIISDANAKTKPWQHVVSSVARAEYSGPVVSGPLHLICEFRFARPKCHYRTGKNAHLLKDDAPSWHTTKPDDMKLCRAVEDALTGIVWVDDSHVAKHSIEKRWCKEGEVQGVVVLVERLA